MADLDLQAVHDELVSVAYEAGAMILAANPAELDTDTKLNCMSSSFAQLLTALKLLRSRRHRHRSGQGRRKDGIDPSIIIFP
jgi:hypothetical protein